MALATNLGFPRIGEHRALKSALEDFWAGRIGPDDLRARATALRATHWQLQKTLGLDHVPSGDFSLYDHVLDTAAMTGAVPERFAWSGHHVGLDTYFRMARGVAGAGEDGVAALEMTKWFDTNYHYLVPELHAGMRFRVGSTQPVDHFLEARALGIHTRPVLLGPVSFLLLSKPKSASLDRLSLLDALLGVYEEILSRLAKAGANWVQMDEPVLALDLDTHVRDAFGPTYARLSGVSRRLALLVATYFGGLGDNLETALRLPVAALHVDLVRARETLDAVLQGTPPSLSLSLGLVDGRNIWKADLDQALHVARRAVDAVGRERIFVAPSCSLLHVPMDVTAETHVDPEVTEWLAFARQKLEEVVLITRAVESGEDAVRDALAERRACLERRRRSPRARDAAVRARANAVAEPMLRRASPHAERRRAQQRHLDLPFLSTTTIGSFPQTLEVRAARAAFRAGKSSREQYEVFLQAQTERAIRLQEEIGLDVLVHGEFERTDMVEFFGEQMDGFLFTRHGWVQSYGSRCVKPPILYGDVSRPRPMTVATARHAQSLTARPVKGMLTGPVTILQWSFVRDDQPRSETCRQIALALRQEVADLETAGIGIIQIDEPALREGLPLRRADWPAYLRWAVDAFRLTASDVRDETQIHTHMCYAEFGDILDAVAAMDADVISLEASRSQMELLDTFRRHGYPNEIGPGVYDIHSPRVPSEEDMAALLRRALEALRPEQLWVNPDCGLKTRQWTEVKTALERMVRAARTVRASLAPAPQQ
jgi:5-methyltetrahydropteroyltriglutamate--homocysteine methyltransferase